MRNLAAVVMKIYLSEIVDVAIHDLLMNSAGGRHAPAEAMGLTLPEPVFPQFPERLNVFR